MTEQSFNEAVDKILKKPKYFRLTKQYMDFYERFKLWLAEKLKEFIEKFILKGSTLPEISDRSLNIIMIIGILISVAILIFIFIMIKKSMRKDVKIKKILGEDIEEGTTPESLRKKAQMHKEKGNYREAVRFAFIGLLLMMNEKNIIYLDEAKTNIEISNYLRKSKYKSYPLFRQIVNLFNEIWYGHKEVKDKRFIKWEQLIDQCWDEVSRFEGV